MVGFLVNGVVDSFDFCVFFFFFQAEDGIRDADVTGVQTCALPISDDVGGADHGGVQSVGADAGALEQTDDAQGSAGAQQGHPLGQASDVIGMKAVHVLVRANALEQLGGVQVGGQRQLYQDAVDGRVIIEPIDQRQQLFLSGVGGQVVGKGDEAHLFTVLALVRDIDFGSGIVADQNDGQTRDAQPLLLALVYLVGDFTPEIGGNLLAIDQLGFHDVPRSEE